MFWIIAVVVFVVGMGYYFLVRPKYKYWVKKGVRQGRPYPIFGDSLGSITRTQSLAEFAEKTYNMFPGHRYSGIYQFFSPVLVLRDPDLIKQMTVKDFDYFTDHMVFLPEDVDPLWATNLLSLKGQRWRDMRSTLSPAFTGSKMKTMFSLILESTHQFAEYLLKQNKNVIEIEMKETFTRFTNDVIASCAFGIKCDSLEDPENTFYAMGKNAANINGFKLMVKFMMYLLVPRIARLLNLQLFDKKVSKFFTTLVKSNVEERERNGIVRQDMIHLLMQARRQGSLSYEELQPSQDTDFATIEESDIGKRMPNKRTQITETDMTAQALIFFLAGFDSVASTMCFMSYELGINPDIQEKLRNEINETSEACGGQLTYEVLLGMKYMDMVVSETLRLWPPAVVTDRECTKPYMIQPIGPQDKPVTLEKGDVIWLPIFGLHRDPQLFPEPARFDPERFSDENKHNIKPYSYMPFGSGPRACIGSRFALLEVKALFYLLQNFEIVPIEKTKIPLQISRKSFNMTAEGGFWFGLRRRRVED